MKKISILLLAMFVLSIFSSSMAFAINGNVVTNLSDIQIDKAKIEKNAELTVKLISENGNERLAQPIKYYTKGLSDELVNKIKNVHVKTLKVSDIVQKRKLVAEKVVKIKENYNQAVEKYKDLDEDIKDQKTQLREAIKLEKECSSDCEGIETQTIDLVKEHVLTMIQIMEQTQERVRNQVLVEESLDQENVDTILIEMDERTETWNQFKLDVENSQTKEEINVVWKNTLNFWNKEKNKVKANIGEVTNSRINSVLVHMNVLENKLDRVEERLVEVEGDVPQEILDMFDEFSVFVAEGNGLFEEGKLLLNEGSVDEAHVKFKEADNKFKEANKLLLTDILPEIKKYLKDEVEDLLRVDSNEEIEIVEIEYKEPLTGIAPEQTTVTEVVAAK